VSKRNSWPAAENAGEAVPPAGSAPKAAAEINTNKLKPMPHAVPCGRIAISSFGS
jgi:hypothetical protein